MTSLTITQGLAAAGSEFRLRVEGIWRSLLRLGRRAPRRLRLCESLPLGERRFVAVVEFDAARFLVGGTPSSLVLLSRLEDDGARAREKKKKVTGSEAEAKRMGGGESEEESGEESREVC